jgi:hypothetical protein
MEMAPGHFPIPAGFQNRDFYPPKFIGGGSGAAGLFWGKADHFRVFCWEAFYRRRGIIRGGPGWSHHRGVQLGARPRPLMVRLALDPPLALVWSSVLF